MVYVFLVEIKMEGLVEDCNKSVSFHTAPPFCYLPPLVDQIYFHIGICRMYKMHDSIKFEVANPQTETSSQHSKLICCILVSHQELSLKIVWAAITIIPLFANTQKV